MQASSREDTCQPRKLIVVPTAVGAFANTTSKLSEPKITKTAKMPSAKPKSPTRLTINAFIEALLAVARSYQKPISKYEHRPTPSQPKNSCTKLSAVTSISMKKVNRLK